MRNRFPMWMFLAAGAACAGPVRPTVVRNMTTLPDDPLELYEQLASANAVRAGAGDDVPRSRLSPKLRRLEGASVVAGSLLGAFFSTSPNALIGLGGALDENLLVDPGHARRKTPAPAGEADRGRDDHPRSEPPPSAGDLVPWIRFDPQP